MKSQKPYLIVFLLVVITFATGFTPRSVGAAPVTQPVYYPRLHFHLLLPTNMDGVNPSKRTDECVFFNGSEGDQQVQICRTANKHITDYSGEWEDVKQGVIDVFPEYAAETSQHEYREVNGMAGGLGVFFYQTSRGTIFANVLYVGETDKDIIFYLYQVPLAYKPAVVEGSDILASLDAFSP